MLFPFKVINIDINWSDTKPIIFISKQYYQSEEEEEENSAMAKTSASVILPVLVIISLFLNGYNAVSVEKGNETEKGEAIWEPHNT